LEYPAHGAVDRGVAEIHTGADPQSVQFSRMGIEGTRRHLQTRGIANIMNGDHLQH